MANSSYIESKMQMEVMEHDGEDPSTLKVMLYATDSQGNKRKVAVNENGELIPGE